jgi:transmembrane 9 superfamily member 2/4
MFPKHFEPFSDLSLLFQIHMLQNSTGCQTLCIVPDVSGEEAKFINDRIREDYALNWLIDGLPAAEMKVDTKTSDLFFDMGFNLGNDDDEPFRDFPALNNHYEIVLRSVC